MIEIRGMTFEDAHAVADFFGMKVRSVRAQIRMGRTDTIGLNKKGREREPFSIRGEVFTSTRAAAERFGTTTSNVAQAIRDGRCDYLGKPSWVRKPMTIDGVEYKSTFAAAKAIGVPYWKLRNAG